MDINFEYLKVQTIPEHGAILITKHRDRKIIEIHPPLQTTFVFKINYLENAARNGKKMAIPQKGRGDSFKIVG